MQDTTITGALRSLGLRYAIAELTADADATSTHLAIGPTGVWLIDAIEPADEAPQDTYVYRDGALWSGDHSLAGAIHTIETRAATVGEVVGQPVRSVICLPEAHLPRPAQLIDRVRVVEPAALRDLILDAVFQLSPVEVATTVSACEALALLGPIDWTPPAAPVRPLRHGPQRFSGGGVRFTLYALTGILLLVVIAAAVAIAALSSSTLAPLRTIPATASCGPSGWQVGFAWPDINELESYHLTVEENGRTIDLGTWTGPETVHAPIFREPGATLHLTATATVRDRSNPLKVSTTLKVPAEAC